MYKRLVLVSIALVVITLAVYVQVGNHKFLVYDDISYVTENDHVVSGLTFNNVVWAFTSFHASNWHPVTWISHMADVQFYGLEPRGHHLTNVIVHTISSLLLLLLLFRLTGSLWQSLFVAALFALHPLHVESVAWVAERKDVLSAFFGFLTLIFYYEYIVKQKSSLYTLSLISFVLSLMSKPMLVTLPIVMLLIDYWPLDRYRHERQEQGLRQLSGRFISLIKEKIPFFACSLFSSIVTIFAQNAGGAISNANEVPAGLRVGNALVAYVKYLYKTFWPLDLAVIYPLAPSIPLWEVIGSLILLLLVSVATIRVRRRHPYLMIGWFWFLITLLPVIGIITVGGQSMADRYTYIPLIGIFIMIAWGVPNITRGLQYREAILILLTVMVIITSAVLTWRQLRYWRDGIPLFRHAVQLTDNNFVAHICLASTLKRRGELDAAIKEYRELLRINPNYLPAHNEMGVALEKKGKLDAAIKEYEEALRIDPSSIIVQNNLESALAAKKMRGEVTR